MKQLNSNRMECVLFGVLASIAIGGGNAKADFIMGEAVNVGPAINGPGEDYGPNISADGLEFYFESGRPGGLGSFDIWVATRRTTDDEWSSAVNLGSVVNSDSDDSTPCISADGLELYFASTRAGGSGILDIWVTTRATPQDPWGPPTNLGPPVNTPYDEFDPSISSDGLSLFFSDLDVPETPIRPGGQGQSDIWVTTRASKEAPWGEPINLGPRVNSAGHDTTPAVSDDGLTLAFGRGSFEAADIWLTRRKTIDDLWEAPVKLGLQTGIGVWGGWEGHPDISADGSTIYWVSSRAGGFGGADIWQVSITPLVDFNGDGRVDGFEFTKVVDNWGQNMPLYDIGPLPWGDGVVNEADLDVLMQYLQEDTPIRVIVDDFEYYNDSDNLIWETWLDFVVNHTGAIIGYADSPHHEIDTVHGGKQAMPLFYDNDGTVLEGTQFETKGTAFYAEAQRKWDVPQDWTIGGIDMLTLWIHGQPHYLEGTPEPLYIALQDSTGNRALIMHPNPVAVTIENWQPWTIDLADFTGVDLTAITMLGLGAGDPNDLSAGGSGGVLVDDIELYPSAGSYDPTLMAHWALDETEGTTAFDSIGEHHGDVMGDPTWLPTEGVVGGALLLDGTNDYVATQAVRDPSEGTMSVFAWVQGGAPGQVIISQVLGANWLMADARTGCLMTDLKQSGRSGKALVSETVITDGTWHRVGLVWDGTHRSLYVDDILVATDTQTALSGSLGGLNLGCDKNATPGSFWAGMIDDVRIYNRAVKP